MNREKQGQLHQSLLLFIVLATLLILFSGCAEETPVTSANSKQSLAQPTTWMPPVKTTSSDTTAGLSIESTPLQNNFRLLVAEWQSATSTLKLTGTSNNNSERLIFKNTSTGETLSSTVSNINRVWIQNIQSPSVVPCRISIVSESGTIESDVTNAPANCNASNNTARSTVTTSTLVYPEAIISSPPTDLSISINQYVNFEATANDTLGTPRFDWSFSGAVPGNNVQNPGKIKFTKPGVYHVELNVTDSRGLSDPTPPMRMITVFDPFSILAAEPIANIDTPAGDQTIMVGSTLNFTGSGSDPASSEPVIFMWDFDGVTAENSAQQNPGDIVFNTPGIFTIVLSVSDSVGNIGTSQITVTVNAADGANQPPVGMITSPSGDITINPGDSLTLEGQASDPDNATEVISYFWELDGVMANSTLQNPGSITYPEAGVYTIKLTATDSMGLSDPNPPSRVINVQTAAPISSDAPNGEILTPAMDTSITAGESITFTSIGTSPTGNEPLIYIWSFDGVAPNATGMETGPITFNTPGIYAVTLLVRDSLAQDPTPAVRLITVEAAGAGAPPLQQTMVGHIITPETDITITPGSSQSFTGFVDGPNLNPPYTYLWLFDGAARNSHNLITDEITFANPGVYNVMFFAIDKDGLFDTRPAMRTVTASDTTPAPGPVASITVPASDMTINIGDTISFDGSVIDVGDTALTYLWTFGGAAEPDSALPPAPVTFNAVGTYVITFTASDSTTTGQPATITITVEDPSSTPTTPGAPSAEIIIADGITTINAGSSINFVGDSSGNALSYLWSINGAQLSDALSPGPIVFDSPGQYEVTFTVIDNADPANPMVATATVIITVLPAGDPLPISNMPQGFIVEPAGDLTINVGGTVNFEGNGENPIDNDPLNYVWDFGNGSSSTAQIPGIVTFTQVGTFTVTLTVDHDGVEFDPTPATVIITVTDGADQAP